MAQNSHSSGGVGFFSLLTLLFIALKLTGHIDWSWWWVLAPLWGSVLLAIIIGFCFFLYIEVPDAMRERRFAAERRRRQLHGNSPVVWPGRKEHDTKAAPAKRKSEDGK